MGNPGGRSRELSEVLVNKKGATNHEPSNLMGNWQRHFFKVLTYFAVQLLSTFAQTLAKGMFCYNNDT